MLDDRVIVNVVSGDAQTPNFIIHRDGDGDFDTYDKPYSDTSTLTICPACSIYE